MTANSNNTGLSKQIKNAFDFIQKLYNESSYLIKEIEGQLSENEKRFIILRPSGYHVSSRSSSGLEPHHVYLWLMRKFAVAFIEEQDTEQKSQTTTIISDDLKVLYYKIILDDKNIKFPKILYGVIYNIKKLNKDVTKFEKLMAHFEYNDSKIFIGNTIDFTSNIVSLKGSFKEVNLLDIKSSEDLMKKVIQPSLKLYDKIK